MMIAPRAKQRGGALLRCRPAGAIVTAPRAKPRGGALMIAPRAKPRGGALWKNCIFANIIWDLSWQYYLRFWVVFLQVSS